MKKVISLIVVLVLCVGLVCTAYAADGSFVPSITYKDGPDIVDTGDYDADSDDKDKDKDSYKDCLVMTSVIEARTKATDITQEERDLLLDTYEKLCDDSMRLPLDFDYVIRDLMYLSRENACKDSSHDHKDKNSVYTVSFDLAVPKNAEVIVLTLVDGEWVAAESVENNGDGTITVKMKDLGVLAFVVK